MIKLPLCLAAILFLSNVAAAELAFVQDVRIYSSAMSGGVLVLEDGDRFGEGVAVLPDLDGDGIAELAVGVPGHDADADAFEFDNGAVWILFPRANGSIDRGVFVTEGLGGLTLDVPVLQNYGSALASLGDIDGDGRPELAVGAPGFDAVNALEGFVDILSLEPTGTVFAARRVDSSDPALVGTFLGGDRFGRAIASVGDVDGDGIVDMAVGGPNRSMLILDGQVWILFLRADGTIREAATIDVNALQAMGSNTFVDGVIGDALAPLGDLDGDGLLELAFSDPRAIHNTAGSSGIVYVASLATDGSLARLVPITDGLGGFGGNVDSLEKFGDGLANVGDLDGDGRAELAVGSTNDDDGGFACGAVWVLFFGEKGEVTHWEKISELENGLPDVLDPGGNFGRGLAWLPDQDGDGVPSLVVGAALANDGGTDRGALFFLDVDATEPAAAFTAAGATSGLAPLTVDFLDLSQGAGLSAWEWDFGDGGTSSAQNPQHVFTTPGTFDVTLTVTSPAGSRAVTRSAFICLDTSARATVRNGSDLNPLVFHPDNTPVLGTTWSGTVDGGAAGATGAVLLLVYEAPLDGLVVTWGELLVDPTSTLVLALADLLVAGSASFLAPVPNDPTLLGLSVSGQVFLTSTRTLTNAIDLVLGDG